MKEFSAIRCQESLILILLQAMTTLTQILNLQKHSNTAATTLI